MVRGIIQTLYKCLNVVWLREKTDLKKERKKKKRNKLKSFFIASVKQKLCSTLN